MRALINFFTQNWWLKLLALILAIVVYYSLKDTTSVSTRRENHSSPPTFLKGPSNVGK